MIFVDFLVYQKIDQSNLQRNNGKQMRKIIKHAEYARQKQTQIFAYLEQDINKNTIRIRSTLLCDEGVLHYFVRFYVQGRQINICVL